MTEKPEWNIHDPDNLLETIDPAWPLHEMPTDEILKKNCNLTDIEEPDVYRIDLIWTTKDLIPVPLCLPPHYKTIVKQMMKRNGYNHLSEVVRRLAYHGLTIHDHPGGNELHQLMQQDAIQNAIHDNDKNTLDVVGESVKCNFLAARCTSVRWNEDFMDMVIDRREEAGITDCPKFFVYLIVLSLRKHPEYTSWYPEFDVIISDVQRQINRKIKRLKSI